MYVKTAAIAAGLAAVLGAGSAFAQPAPQGSPGQPGSYQGGYQGSPAYQRDDQDSHQSARHHHHGIMSLIKEEARAGRISQKEASLLERKIHELHAQKRAEREARSHGERGAPGQMQQSQ